MDKALKSIPSFWIAWFLTVLPLIGMPAYSQRILMQVMQPAPVTSSTPAILQSNTGLCAANPPSKAFLSNVTAGNRILVIFSQGGNTAVPTPTDTRSTSYSLIINGNFSGNTATAIWIGTLATSGSDTVSLTGTYSFGDLDILEISGGAGTTAGSINSGSQAFNLTTTGVNALIVTTGYGNNSSGTYGSISPWTSLWNSNGCHSHGAQWETQAASGTYAVGFNSITNANFNWYTSVAIN